MSDKGERPQEDRSSPRLDLSLYTLPHCQPCELIKGALADALFDDVRPISIYCLDIDEVRALRKQLGQRLAFPLLLATSGETLLGCRLGVCHSDAESERAAIREWLDELNRQLEAKANRACAGAERSG